MSETANGGIPESGATDEGCLFLHKQGSSPGLLCGPIKNFPASSEYLQEIGAEQLVAQIILLTKDRSLWRC